MPRTRLNLAALRSPALEASPESPPTLSRLVASEGTLTVSRRELLGLAGVAALALPPLTKGLTPALLGRFEVAAQPGRVALKLGGRERWVVDVRRFAGTPRLEVQQAGNGTRIVLTGARYPGTKLPADFTCDLQRGLTGWRMRLRLALTGKVMEMPLESWLAGAEPARTEARLSALACDLGTSGSVKLSGAAQVDFSPDGTLRLHGADLVTFRHAGARLQADRLVISPASGNSDSLIQKPPANRTVLVITLPPAPSPKLGEGGSSGILAGVLANDGHGRLLGQENAFDTIAIETGETRGGRVVSAFVARDLRGESALAYQPGESARDTAGEPFALRLRNPRYAVACDGDDDERAFLADFGPQPQSLHCGNCNLIFSAGDASAPPFEIVTRGDQVRYLRCEPTLHSLTAPLAGALVETAYADAGTRISLTAATEAHPPTILRPIPRPLPTPAPVTPPAGEVLIKPGQIGTVIKLPGFVVPVVRHEDMLALTFRFLNLTFKAAGGGQPAQLVRTAPGAAYIVVEFPPQHIGEEALFETAAGYPISVASPNDPDASNTQSETSTPKAPPLNSRLSGPSRLSFRLPDTTQSVPYSLAALLDWSKFDLSVAPAALPPPPPPKKYHINPAAGGVILSPLTPHVPGPMTHPPAGTMQPMLHPTAAYPTAAAPSAAANQPGLTIPQHLYDPGIIAAQLQLLKVQEPALEQTAIEAPYRLTISPSELAGWVHSIGAVTRNGRTELWHTRLGVKGDAGHIYDTRYEYGWDGASYKVLRLLADDHYADMRTVRALWSPDYPLAPTHNNSPFRMSLDGHDRYELVKLTGDPQLDTIAKFRERIVSANRLMLTALGVWMNVRYAHDLPVMGLSVEEWVHQATMGRDQYVKVVYKGYLYPFGHEAALVKVTERKFLRVGNQNIAYLLQRMFIVVREPVMTYPAFGQPNDGRAMPFRRVRITTLVTPNLNPPENSALLPTSYSAQAAFWPRVTGLPGDGDFQWHLIAEDWDGQRSEFTVPLVFVGVESPPGQPNVGVAFDSGSIATINSAYMNAANLVRRQTKLLGQSIAFAESQKPGDTQLETDSLTFGVEPDAGSANPQSFFDANQVRAYPTIAEAQVRVPAAATVAGAGGTVAINLHERYVQHGWDTGQNPAEAFAKLLPSSLLPIGFSPDKAGGLATPNLNVEGLSRAFGPVGDIENFAAGNFDPSKFFDIGAKILGTVKLMDVIQSLFGLDQIPKLLTEKITDPTTGIPTAIETKLDWNPKLQSWPEAFPVFHADENSKLNITALMRLDLAAQAATATIDGKLEKVALNLVPISGVADYFIQVNFKLLSFHSDTNQKVDVKCDLGDINFGGPLSFINTLSKVIPLNGFVDPPILNVSPSGIDLGYSLALPSIAVGMFSLQNISFSAGLNLPFIGGPMTMRFAFCSREQPFLLTVSIFGGGGFFATTLGLDGIVSMEASFEFGGNFSMDLGVASGGVYIMAGIYFKMAGSAVTLEGYLRCGGNLNVLGIINISIEFYMSLTYQSDTGMVKGRASLDVEISILFFSVSVTLTVEKQFAGSSSSAWLEEEGVRLAAVSSGPSAARMPSGIVTPRLFSAPKPPTFGDLMTPADWAAYAAAFA